MWGTRYVDVKPHERERFIPTHVGNTGTVYKSVYLLPVHPHACGEHAGNSYE